jgi:hypothetical protein
MFLTDISEPRQVNGVMIIGPDLFAVDSEGISLSPIASAFPRHNVLITGRGIHAMQGATMVDLLREEVFESEHRDLTREEEEEIFQSAVSLLIRGQMVLIRSNPKKMELIFAADEVLQRLLPKERIQFTGMHLASVRDRLRHRGESWRIAPTPHSVEEIGRYIQSSRVHVGTGAVYYQNAPIGGRFITYEEFIRIRPLITEKKDEALARLKEIVHLTQLTNNQCARELSFFLPADASLPTGDLKDIILALEKASAPEDMEEAKRIFDRFAASFAETAGPDLIVDGENHLTWRTTMFCRLYDINEKMVEEWALGLSPEFYLNVRWLPGARLVGGELLFESNVAPRVRSLITHFWRTWNDVVSINVGRVESSQTQRDRTGEQREVYLVVLGQADGHEDIRLVRMIKWDVMHRLKMGIPQVQAINDTFQYREYIFDRLQAAAALGVPILSYTEVRFDEEVPGLGWIPVFFFDREYVPGLVTDKIPPARYAREGFIARLAYLLGKAAAVSLTLGRACPRTRHVFFDDGDEIIQFDDQELPARLVIAETTGSFTDWTSPIAEILPHCLSHLAGHLEKARSKGIQQDELATAIAAFAEGLIAEVERMQQLLQTSPSRLWSLFTDRSREPGSVRSRWEGILYRIERTSADEILHLVAESPHLASFD